MIASIITVNFGDTAPTNGLVKSLEKCADLNKINLIIVDNLSSEKSYKELKLIKEKTKIKDLAFLVAKLFNKKIKIKSSQLKKGSTKIRVPNINKIKRLGFKKKYNLKTGLNKIIQN